MCYLRSCPAGPGRVSSFPWLDIRTRAPGPGVLDRLVLPARLRGPASARLSGVPEAAPHPMDGVERAFRPGADLAPEEPGSPLQLTVAMPDAEALPDYLRRVSLPERSGLRLGAELLAWLRILAVSPRLIANVEFSDFFVFSRDGIQPALVFCPAPALIREEQPRSDFRIARDCWSNSPACTRSCDRDGKGISNPSDRVTTSPFARSSSSSKGEATLPCRSGFSNSRSFSGRRRPCPEKTTVTPRRGTLGTAPSTPGSARPFPSVESPRDGPGTVFPPRHPSEPGCASHPTSSRPSRREAPTGSRASSHPSRGSTTPSSSGSTGVSRTRFSRPTTTACGFVPSIATSR